MPKVSIILPVYNTEENFLRQSIDSILAQTLQDFELIVVDDSKTDAQKKVIESYNQENIIYVHPQKCTGLGGARNVGISIAKGEYILCVDSDDWIDKTLLEKTYKKAKEQNLDVMFFGVYNYDDITKEISLCDNLPQLPKELEEKVFDFRQPDFYEGLFDIYVTAWSKLYRRKFIVENDLKFPENLIFEDNGFFFRFVLKAKRMGFTREMLYYYRRNSQGSLSFKPNKKQFDLIKILENIETTFKENNVFEELKIRFWNYKMDVYYYWFNQIDIKFRKEFKKLIKNAIKKMSLNKEDLEKMSCFSKFVYEYFTKSKIYYVKKLVALYY